jgi:glycosyltransferase involved in cell wall biosynthesis
MHHLFTAICRHFPGSLVFFYEKMPTDRPWKDDAHPLDYPFVKLRQRIDIPGFGYVNPGLIPHLLRQPHGTIHLMGSCSRNALLIRLLGCRKGGRLVWWNDGGFPEQISRRRRKLYPTIWRPAVRAAFTPGRSGRRYVEALGFTKIEIFNSYFSHDVALFDQERRSNGARYRQTTRSQLEIKPDDFVILNISRFLDWKRLEDLASALLRAETELGDNVHLLLIGDGEHRGPLEEMKLGLRRVRLHHLRAVDYPLIHHYYAAADLLVFPSEGDIWGLVVNEALSMGVPVICTDRIGASEMVRDGENGYVLPVRRPDLISEAILRLYADRALLQRLSASATSIRERWNTSRALDEVERLVQFCSGC